MISCYRITQKKKNSSTDSRNEVSPETEPWTSRYANTFPFLLLFLHLNRSCSLFFYMFHHIYSKCTCEKCRIVWLVEGFLFQGLNNTFTCGSGWCLSDKKRPRIYYIWQILKLSVPQACAHAWLLAKISNQINGNIAPGPVAMCFSGFYKASG